MANKTLLERMYEENIEITINKPFGGEMYITASKYNKVGIGFHNRKEIPMSQLKIGDEFLPIVIDNLITDLLVQISKKEKDYEGQRDTQYGLF